MAIDPWLLSKLVCPRDHLPLTESDGFLTCSAGHKYPIVQGVPILLTDDMPFTLFVGEASFKEGQTGSTKPPEDPFFLSTIGIIEQNWRDDLEKKLKEPLTEGIDPVVSYLVGATNGIAYRHLVGQLKDYPIPDIRIPRSKTGEFLIDIGCSWGRWSHAAARKGYKPIGVDPSLGAILAARRVAAQLGLDSHFVVGDARCLPFAKDSVDLVHTYGVLQHFLPPDADRAFSEMGRVVKRTGRSLCQMPTTYGIRCLYQQFKRLFRKREEFDITYRSVPALRRLLTQKVGPTAVSVDCYFGIGLQAADMRFMPPLHRTVIQLSEVLRKVAKVFPPLVLVADSIFMASSPAGKPPAPHPTPEMPPDER